MGGAAGDEEEEAEEVSVEVEVPHFFLHVCAVYHFKKGITNGYSIKFSFNEYFPIQKFIILFKCAVMRKQSSVSAEATILIKSKMHMLPSSTMKELLVVHKRILLALSSLILKHIFTPIILST